MKLSCWHFVVSQAATLYLLWPAHKERPGCVKKVLSKDRLTQPQFHMQPSVTRRSLDGWRLDCLLVRAWLRFVFCGHLASLFSYLQVFKTIRRLYGSMVSRKKLSIQSTLCMAYVDFVDSGVETSLIQILPIFLLISRLTICKPFW